MLYQDPPKGFIRRPVKYGPYSPSRLVAAMCAQRFFGQYVRKDRSVTSSVNSARGSAIHLVLSQITKHLMEGSLITPTLISKWVTDSIALHPMAYEQVDLVRASANAYLSNPSPYMNKDTNCEKSFAVAFYEEASFDDTAVLQRGYVPVEYSNEDGSANSNAFFGGRLDQISVDEITKTVTILDHKSTPSANKNPEHTFQLGAYGWLVSMFYPGYKIRTVIHYAHPDLNFYGSPTYWSSEELSEMEMYIHDRVWSLEGYQEFPALPGSACDYCHMVQECPENLALAEQKARGQVDLNIRSFADLPRIAKHLRVVGALYDELNSTLKNGIEKFAPQNGVAIDGMVYKFKASDEAVDWVSTDIKIRDESVRAQQLLVDANLSKEERRKYELMAKLPDLAAVLKHWGVDPMAFKEWQGQKLKNLWRLDKPGMMEMLKDYVVKSKTTRFGGYKE